MDNYFSYGNGKRYEVGSVYYSTEGYAFIKTENGPRRYTHHILRKYLKHIREPFFVSFVDSNKTNFEIPNLAIVAKDLSKRWIIKEGRLILQTVEGKPLWSRKYDSCIICQSVKFKYAAKGMCRSCYHIDYKYSESPASLLSKKRLRP